MMISAPWYLLAFGIFLIVIGWIFGEVFRASTSDIVIDDRMKDEEIADLLERQSSMSVSSIIMFFEFLCVFASVAWRLIRRFL